MKFKLSKKECKIIINALYALSETDVLKGNAVSSEVFKMVDHGAERLMENPKPSVIKIINKLKEDTNEKNKRRNIRYC